MWKLISDFKQGRELPFIWPFLSWPIEMNQESVLKQTSQIEIENLKNKPFHPCGRTPRRSKNFERHLAKKKSIDIRDLRGVCLWLRDKKNLAFIAAFIKGNIHLLLCSTVKFCKVKSLTVSSKEKLASEKSQLFICVLHTV